MTLHRTRHLFIRQQTAVINAIRAQLAEFGIVAPVGRKGVEELLNVVMMQARTGCLWLHGCVWPHWGLSCAAKGADSGVRPYDYSLAPLA